MTKGDILQAERRQYGTFEEYARACMDIGLAPEYVENPYTGQGCMLPPLAVAVHDTIKGLEADLADEGTERLFLEALYWFRENLQDEYYTLLD